MNDLKPLALALGACRRGNNKQGLSGKQMGYDATVRQEKGSMTRTKRVNKQKVQKPMLPIFHLDKSNHGATFLSLMGLLADLVVQIDFFLLS